METIKEAIEYLAENMKEGATCPCCKQHVKLHEINLTRSMVKVLASIYRYKVAHEPMDGWIHLSEEMPELSKGRVTPKLVHWDLLEPKSNNSGKWRVTKKGLNFLLGRIEIPATVLVYNARVRGFNGEMMSVTKHFKDFNFGD
jgi:hypothetical protein